MIFRVRDLLCFLFFLPIYSTGFFFTLVSKLNICSGSGGRRRRIRGRGRRRGGGGRRGRRGVAK